MNDPRAPAADLNTALASYAAAVAGPEDAEPAVREYRLREVAILFGVCAASLLALGSEGLMSWVQRMELGPVQTGCRAVLGPVNAMMDQVGLTSPRRWLVASGEWVGHRLGVGEDPLLAEGWEIPSDPTPPAPAEEPIALDPIEPVKPPEAIGAEPELPSVAPGADPAVPVLLLGDSMIAGSLGASLTRALARDRRLRVVHAFQTATGLSRPDVYDWRKVVPALLARERPGLIVCSLGANDRARIDDGDRRLDFGEAGWRSAYSARVIEVMRALSGNGARVLWLGLPPMRSGRFSNHARYLNAIFAQSAKKVPGVEFLELRMLVSDPAGEYSTFVMGPDGRLIRFRLDDGVHYSPAGARAITRWVVDWIYERYRKLPR